MYQPYREWYSQVYSALDPWKGPFTPISSYLYSLVTFVVRGCLMDGLGDT